MSKIRQFAVSVLVLAATGIGLVELATAGVIIAPSSGYSITWDGNDGDFFTDAGPALAPPNLASATGASAFASGVLGAGPHTTPDLVRNGTYGNISSWIGSAATPNFVGINLNGTYDITSLAWGRDNGTSTANGDSAGGISGQFVDRNLGTYTVQITNDINPTAATTNWTSVGTLTYDAIGNDGVIGGAFTPYYRHEYGVGKSGGPLLATGVRLEIVSTVAPNDIAIDELEVYGASPVPQSGLRAWVRGDGDVATAGPAITQMRDHSLNGNHASPGLSPDLIAGAINGLPAARFDAPVEHLNMPDTLDIENSDYEIFIVAKSSSSATQFLTSAPSSTGNYELQLNGAAGARFIPSTTATASPDTIADLGVNGMFASGRTHLFNSRVDGGVGYLRVVGMENGDTVADAQSPFATDGGGRQLTLGVRGDATYSFAGDMGEVIVFDRALNAAERRQVERYLSTKWNAPLNVASQTQGGVAFADQVYGGVHQINHLNDAKYGNDFSWLGNNQPGDVPAMAGVKFDDAYNISSLAFGRDATGALTDRDEGTYTFQYTSDDFDPNSLASVNAASWTTFFMQTYTNLDVNPHLRHQYDFSLIRGARGVRVLVSNNRIAIDELEIYGVIPEPSGLALAGMALMGLAAVRRRRK